MNKKVIVIIVFVIGILFIGCGIGFSLIGSKENKTDNTVEKEDKNPSIDSNNYKKNEDGSFDNTSKKISEDHVNGDFSIQNMSVSINSDSEELADYQFTIRNNGSNSYDSLNVTIVFILSDGSKMKVPASPVSNLTAGGSVEVKSDAPIVIIGAVDYEYIVE